MFLDILTTLGGPRNSRYEYVRLAPEGESSPPRGQGWRGTVARALLIVACSVAVASLTWVSDNVTLRSPEVCRSHVACTSPYSTFTDTYGHSRSGARLGTQKQRRGEGRARLHAYLWRSRGWRDDQLDYLGFIGP